MTSKLQLWQHAASFAARAHRHHVRKDNVTPYVAHVYRVAMTVRQVFEVDDPEILAAALLHDTIEDCDIDYDDIHAEFGAVVAGYVACLTKDMRLIEDEREKAYDEQLARGPWQAKLIKLADVFDNLTEAGVCGGSLPKMIVRARRAVELARGVPELDRARERVEKLIASRNGS